MVVSTILKNMSQWEGLLFTFAMLCRSARGLAKETNPKATTQPCTTHENQVEFHWHQQNRHVQIAGKTPAIHWKRSWTRQG